MSSRLPGASQGDLYARLAKLERAYEELLQQVKAGRMERTPKLILPGNTIHWCRSDAAVAKDASGTFSIWSDAGDTGENLTGVLNKIGAISASGKDAYISRVKNSTALHVLNAEC
jgi:hypothetical protein